MIDASDMSAGAVASQERVTPFNLRFEFDSYAETRRFLDQLADLSKREAYYPDVSFGKTYANISIDGNGQATLRERKSSFIDEMQAFAKWTGS
ncbi:MAG: 4a-hydroxytetrahydrobiopterin dehydratase family protein [Acidobacteriaceae bacterium]